MSFLYDATPTIAAFSKSEKFGRLIAGPVGSGKTTGVIVELLRRAIQQQAGDDGLKYTRFAVVRQTLKQLKDTVLKDMDTWLNANGIGEWKVSDSTYFINFDRVRSEFILLPLEDAADQGRLLSMQLTGAWLSEAIEMDISVLGPLSGRIGRYPSGVKGAPTWNGIVADTNMPPEMTAWHKFMENPPADWSIWKQPSGLAWNAENLDHLLQTEETRKLPLGHPDRIARGREYYNRIVRLHGIDSDFVKRYVKAEYGDDPSGRAVFRETFRTAWHVVDDTQVIPGYPIIVGQDFGRDPWSLICQPDHLGRLLVHEEVPAENIGLEKHCQQSLRGRLLQSKYLGCKIALVGDPSGVAKSTHSEETSFELLGRLGFPCFPAPTNDLDPRLRAVESFLGRHTNGGPSMLINREGCPHLIRALGGGYRFEFAKVTGLRKPAPKKDNFSHVADTLQYVCLVCHGGMLGAIARRMQPNTKRPSGAPVSAAGWT
jgi:hypothetical protein